MIAGVLFLLAAAGAAWLWRGWGNEEARLQGLDRVQLADYVSRRPDSALGHQYLAGELFNANRFGEAVTEFRKAIALDPRSAAAHRGLGVALHFAGDDEAAERTLRSALELDPSSAEAHFFLALTIAPRHPREAMEALTRCTELDPTYAGGWYQLALLRTDLNYNQEAVEAAQRAIQIEPETGVYHEALGEAQLRAGQMGDSLSSLKRAIELDPNLSKAHLLYGTVMLQTVEPDLDAAEEAARTAVRLAGPSPQASITLARIAERRGDLPAARQHYEQALEMAPSAKPALFGLGSLLVRVGEEERGRTLLAEFERLAEIDDALAAAASRAQSKPDDPERQVALARALRRAGQLRLAVDRYELALGLREDPAVRAELAAVARDLSDQSRTGQSTPGPR